MDLIIGAAFLVLLVLSVIAILATVRTVAPLVVGGLTLAIVMDLGDKVIKSLNLPRPRPEQLEPVLMVLVFAIVVLVLVLLFWDRIWEKIATAE